VENKTYIFYEDPGHGWVAVPMDHLIALGVADKITSYSYLLGNMAFLEEDCDLPTFVRAYKKKFGKAPKGKTVYQEHTSIRSYPNYDYEKEVA
jgi:hypothetical protein